MEKRWIVGASAGVFVLAVAASGVAFAASNGSAASGRVGWAATAAGLVFDLSAAATLGLLILACVALPSAHDLFPRILDAAGISAGVMTVFAAVASFTQTNSTAWLVTALIGAVVTAFCFLIRSAGGAAFLSALVVAGFWPIVVADAGDLPAGGAEALMIHVVFASVWLGGLIGLVVIQARAGGSRLRGLFGRFRPVASASLVVVAVSGVAESIGRLGPLGNLASGYGVLLVVRVVLLAGAASVLLVARSRMAARSVVRFVFVELGLLAVAFGVSVVLPVRAIPISRMPTGQGTPAATLTQHPLPPALDAVGMLTQWRFDVGWALACAFAAFFYLAGVHRLRVRGRRWPAVRTISWIVGLALAAWLTSGGPAVYRVPLFSIQLNVQLVWALIVPFLVVLGDPVTLLRRALPLRADGSRGTREWWRSFAGSRTMRFFAHPVVAAVVLAGSMWAFTVGPLLRWSTMSAFGHGWAATQLLVAGLLFAGALTRRGPRPRLSLRLALLAAVAASLVAIGVWAATTDALLVADWFGAMGRTWGAPPPVDQAIGGTVFWILSLVCTVAMGAGSVFASHRVLSWRETRR